MRILILTRHFFPINRPSGVLRKDGIAILEFYNPFSFKAIVNRLSDAPSKVFIQYHSPSQVRDLVGKCFKIKRVDGARIITPAAFFHKIPFISVMLKKIEKKISNTFLARFAGYYIVTVEKK